VNKTLRLHDQFRKTNDEVIKLGCMQLNIDIPMS
jgi:hypothetical protein